MLQTEGMKIESAAWSGAEINGKCNVNKMEKYSFHSLKALRKTQQVERKCRYTVSVVATKFLADNLT